MIRVWKYPLSLNSIKDKSYPVTIQVPQGAIPLCVADQNGASFVWMQVDEDSPKADFTFHIVGTGFGAVPVFAKYLGSVIGDYVWHVYY